MAACIFGMKIALHIKCARHVRKVKAARGLSVFQYKHDAPKYLLVIAELSPCVTTVVIRRSDIGVEFDCFSVVRNSLLVLAHVSQAEAAILAENGVRLL